MSSAPSSGSTSSRLAIALLYPNLLGTYGDAGNAIVLAHRARARGHAVEVITVNPGDAVPGQADIYLLGGGEDAKQTAAAAMLREDGALVAAANRGAAVLGICAGYQLLGTTFLGVGGRPTQGLGLLDVTTDRLAQRAVGNILARPTSALADRLPELIGFENHGGATTLGPDASPLGLVEIGVGNGGSAAQTGSGSPSAGTATPSARTEGAVQGGVFGTYLHGPALALNPALADLILAVVTGPLPPTDDDIIEGLRRHRLEHVLPQTERAGRRQGIMARLGRGKATPSGAVATLSGE